MTDSQSGYSSTLQSAKNVYARADDHFEIDYTVKANSDGFKKVVNGLRALSMIQFPNETTDVPTKDDFYDALNSIYASIQSGVDGLRADSAKISSAAQALDTVKTNHENDTQSLQRVLESTESADTTDAIVRFQTLQTQLQASYQVTAVLSQLSLARVLGN
jgi:flagellar hook-associated protein 3 FlgL